LKILKKSWHTKFAVKRLKQENDSMSLAESLAREHYG